MKHILCKISVNYSIRKRCCWLFSSVPPQKSSHISFAIKMSFFNMNNIARLYFSVSGILLFRMLNAMRNFWLTHLVLWNCCTHVYEDLLYNCDYLKSSYIVQPSLVFAATGSHNFPCYSFLQVLLSYIYPSLSIVLLVLDYVDVLLHTQLHDLLYLTFYWAAILCPF